MSITGDNIDMEQDIAQQPQPPKKSKKPKVHLDRAFTQQRLPAWQPILSPPWVIASFFIIFLIFTPIGIAIFFASQSVIETNELQYDNLCTMTINNQTAPVCSISKREIVVPALMKAPVYMYYKLTNFYQNHRRYAASRSDSQLGGTANINPSDAQSTCAPITFYQPTQDITNETSSASVYVPCGLVAWSMFNDTFVLYSKDAGGNFNVLCDGPNAGNGNSSCTKKGIAWKSDVDVKFKYGATGRNSSGGATYYGEPTHLIPDVQDEDFIVWMRTAALPNFRKLYRIINVDIPAGTYYLDIEQRYPVSNFSGTKSVILTTSSWIGGKNLFLAIAYMAVGGLCFLLAAAFLVGYIIQKIKFRRSSNPI
ncbi:cell cycle control protein 50A [Acrasis kona]|uniref:Cell cycle control protein 50A n=1 Tax=Acrasis kona TaxID=1008807 RepID=A0AAW2Z6L1_9EUKA